jgi:hypothetical protein
LTVGRHDGVSNLAKDAIMHPTFHLGRRWLLICRAAVTTIVVIGLVDGCAANSSAPKGPSSTAVAVPRSDTPSHQAKPRSATPAAEPDPLNGAVTVVPGQRVIDGVKLGFPHTVVGAISAAANDETEFITLDAGHAATVGRLTADSSNRTLPQDVAQGVSDIRQLIGVPATGPVPAGYSVHMKAAEYQVRNVTPDKVTVLLLCELNYTQPGLGTHGRIGIFALFMHWEHGDWKEAGDAGGTYVKLVAVPDSAKAAALGWKALL